MHYKDDKYPPNSPQILPFPVEKRPPQLSINIDDTDNRLFYIEYYPMVKNHCLSILGNKEDAEDMAGSVFEKIQKLKAEGRFNIKNPNPIPYLFEMVKNMNKNEKKRKRRELIEIYDIATNESLNYCKNKGEQEQKVWEAGIIDNGYEQVEAEIIVNSILKEQDETTRKIYLYNYHDEMTLEQIGEAVGLRKSAVHKRIKNLEKKVKEAVRGIKK